MIVRPRQPTEKLGRKNIVAATNEEAIAIYRKRFAPRADNVDMIVEGAEDSPQPGEGGAVEDESPQSEDTTNAGEPGRTHSGVVETDVSVDGAGAIGASISGDSADE